MKSVLVTGGTGYAGRFIVDELLLAGYAVTVMSRNAPEPDLFSRSVNWQPGSLDPDKISPDMLSGFDFIVHAAFHHLPGKYRGGEGDDPETFRRLNMDGSVSLFRAAKNAGAKRAVFLSSRAVYGVQPPGAMLNETTRCKPDTLYGQVKLATEHALIAMTNAEFLPVSLRITGIYGPAGSGRKHKWFDLFADYRSEKAIPPRAATEVHGGDMATAVRLVLESGREAIHAASPGQIFNVSDILLDRHDLLEAYSLLTGCTQRLPARMTTSEHNAMNCSSLEALGWRKRGRLDLDRMYPDSVRDQDIGSTD